MKSEDFFFLSLKRLLFTKNYVLYNNKSSKYKYDEQLKFYVELFSCYRGLSRILSQEAVFKGIVKKLNHDM